MDDCCAEPVAQPAVSLKNTNPSLEASLKSSLSIPKVLDHDVQTRSGQVIKKKPEKLNL